MPRIFFALLVLVSPILAAVSSAGPAGAASPNLPRDGCWGVFGEDEQLTVSHADEVLCVDKSGRASIRESTIFGDGVKGCNVVMMYIQGDKLVIDINYNRCTNNSPSHTLRCGAPSGSGVYTCTELFADTSDKKGLPAKLAPLPAGQ
jgi:hypothetical protein